MTPFRASPTHDEPQGLRGDGWNSSVTCSYWWGFKFEALIGGGTALFRSARPQVGSRRLQRFCWEFRSWPIKTWLFHTSLDKSGQVLTWEASPKELILSLCAHVADISRDGPSWWPLQRVTSDQNSYLIYFYCWTPPSQLNDLTPEFFVLFLWSIYYPL